MTAHDIIATRLFGWQLTPNLWLADHTALTPFKWSSNKALPLLEERLNELGVMIGVVDIGLGHARVTLHNQHTDVVYHATGYTEGDAVVMAVLQFLEP